MRPWLLSSGLAALTLVACSKPIDDPLTGGGGSTGTGTTAGGGGSTGSTSGTGTTSSGSTTSTSGSTGDPYAAARQACIDKINALRATKGLPAYGRWADAEACVDQQATSDETSNSPHGAWIGGTYACNGSGQNECLGAGPGGVESCLESMWNEKNQAGCAGCDACAGAYDPNCPNCDFYGQKTGNVCGHYVNMSAKYFTMAACGFSSLGGWDAINFK
jgi:hypothetical protein